MKKLFSFLGALALYYVILLVAFIAIAPSFGQSSMGKALPFMLFIAWAGGNMYCRWYGSLMTFIGSFFLSLFGIAMIGGVNLLKIPQPLLVFDDFLVTTARDLFGAHMLEGLVARMMVVAVSVTLIVGKNHLVDFIGTIFGRRPNRVNRLASVGIVGTAIWAFSMQVQGGNLPARASQVIAKLPAEMKKLADKSPAPANPKVFEENPLLSLLPEMVTGVEGNSEDADELLKQTWEAEKKDRKTQSAKLAPHQSSGPGAELFPLPEE